MMLRDHINNKNLHHAYLIEGNMDDVIKEILECMEDLDINTKANADFSKIVTDSFKTEDMQSLKSLVGERGFGEGKKIFILGANSFLLEAQNGLLKIFEEPIRDTHFFVIVPDINSLLKTFVSRFYVVRSLSQNEDKSTAVKFLNMNLRERLDFIKNLLNKEEDLDEESEVVNLESNNKKALNFLNELESLISSREIIKTTKDSLYVEHLFAVRRFLRMPGSSVKMLMESVALSLPYFKDMQSR